MTRSLESAKLYVGCGLTQAPQEFIDNIGLLKDTLKKNYDVFDFVGLTGGTAADVFNWDIGHCVADCNLFVGVCDYPALGLGWELAEAARLGKPILATAHETALISRLVLGAAEVIPSFDFRRYGNLVLDVPRFVEERLLTLQNTPSFPPFDPGRCIM